MLKEEIVAEYHWGLEQGWAKEIVSQIPKPKTLRKKDLVSFITLKKKSEIHSRRKIQMTLANTWQVERSYFQQLKPIKYYYLEYRRISTNQHEEQILLSISKIKLLIGIE